jgi:hypothetical protein
MLCIVTLSVIMLSIVTLSVIILNGIMLSIVTLRDIMLSVMVPQYIEQPFDSPHVCFQKTCLKLV